VSAEGLAFAPAAATSDALHALLDEAGRLKVTNAWRLRDFFEESPDVADAIARAAQQTVETHVDFGPDQVAEVELRLSLRDLVRILTRVRAEVAPG